MKKREEILRKLRGSLDDYRTLDLCCSCLYITKEEFKRDFNQEKSEELKDDEFYILVGEEIYQYVGKRKKNY